MRSAMLEVITAARYEHISLNESDIETWQNQLDALTPESRTSMCQDIMAGRKTEVELFSAAVIELGKKHGFQTPVNQVLYRQLRALEACASAR
jgi:2-dehydropantoate 2-reductase